MQVLLSLCIHALQAELLSARQTALGQSPERRVSGSQMYCHLGSSGNLLEQGFEELDVIWSDSYFKVIAMATFAVLSMK